MCSGRSRKPQKGVHPSVHPSIRPSDRSTLAQPIKSVCSYFLPIESPRSFRGGRSDWSWDLPSLVKPQPIRIWSCIYQPIRKWSYFTPGVRVRSSRGLLVWIDCCVDRERAKYVTVNDLPCIFAPHSTKVCFPPGCILEYYQQINLPNWWHIWLRLSANATVVMQLSPTC